MMAHRLFYITIVSLLIAKNAFGQYNKRYKFDQYVVETYKRELRNCTKIYKAGRGLYESCADNGIGYTLIDTLSLNNDNIPDFVYAYKTKQFTVIGLLVSCADTIQYKKLEVKFIFEPAVPASGTYRPFLLKDIDNDGYRDLVLNVIEDKGKYYPVKKSADTVGYPQLKKSAEGKMANTEFQGIYFDKNKFHSEQGR